MYTRLTARPSSSSWRFHCARAQHRPGGERHSCSNSHLRSIHVRIDCFVGLLSRQQPWGRRACFTVLIRPRHSCITSWPLLLPEWGSSQMRMTSSGEVCKCCAAVPHGGASTFLSLSTSLCFFPQYFWRYPCYRSPLLLQPLHWKARKASCECECCGLWRRTLRHLSRPGTV